MYDIKEVDPTDEVILIPFPPKVSLNTLYSTGHWTKRHEAKKLYKELMWVYHPKKINYPCEVEYQFEWKSRPLDCSNCPVKAIEDGLFDDDSSRIVKKVIVTSRKSDRNFLTIIVRKAEVG